MQDLVRDAALLAWGGLNLGTPTEVFRLYLSLRALAAATAAAYPPRGGGDGCGTMRLWGKLLGTTHGDYLVAECRLPPGADGDGDAGGDPPPRDALGRAVQQGGRPGPNEAAYWACSGGVGAPWVRLPHVTPHQLTAARGVRRWLTGDPTAPVGGHPPFPGSEAHLLRATIAAIAADAAIAPVGAWRVREGEDEEAVSGGGGGDGVAIVPVDETAWAPPTELAQPRCVVVVAPCDPPPVSP